MESITKSEQGKPILQVEHLKKYFPVKRKSIFQREKQQLKAVDDVSFVIHEGETFALVGESGCGKTTVGRTILRLNEPTEGNVFFCGEDLLRIEKNELRKTRRNMQMIFQDPCSSLNPRMTIFDSIADPIKLHKIVAPDQISKYIYGLMDKVGLPSWLAERYPHEFSGGQLQRACIARALALQPKFIVCDEPVSALDVSIQSQVLNLLEDLQKDLNLSYLFISHGLPVVKHIADRIGVMYLGKLVETATSSRLFENALHPYTQALISAVPVPNPDRKSQRVILQGDVPSPINPPVGCRFCSRCPLAQEVCHKVSPELREVEPDHQVACHMIK